MKSIETTQNESQRMNKTICSLPIFLPPQKRTEKEKKKAVWTFFLKGKDVESPFCVFFFSFLFLGVTR